MMNKLYGAALIALATSLVVWVGFALNKVSHPDPTCKQQYSELKQVGDSMRLCDLAKHCEIPYDVMRTFVRDAEAYAASDCSVATE